MTTRTRLALAVLLSLAFHLAVISGEWMPMPQVPGEPRPLLARLVPMQELKPSAPRPKARARPRAALFPVPDVAAVEAPSPLALPDAFADEDMAEVAPDEPAAAEPPQQLALAASTSTDAAAPHSLPRRGRISFTLLYGDERLAIGSAVHTWAADGDSYSLATVAESTGLLELLFPQRLRYESRGKITPHGIRPDSFQSTRTRRGRSEVAQALFDWTAGSVRYGDAGSSRSAPLPADAQDLASFIFQFVVAPPAPGRYRVPIVTGSRLEAYDIEVSAEERIETPLGVMRALPIRQLPRPGNASIEIWLAADYRYLPVRIRHYDRRGNLAAEQVAGEIRVSDE